MAIVFYFISIPFLLAVSVSASRAARIEIAPLTEGLRGQSADVFVNLFGDGADVASAMVQVQFPEGLTVRVREDGTPDCDDFTHVDIVTAAFPVGCGSNCPTVNLTVMLGRPLPEGTAGEAFASCVVDVPADFNPGFYPVIPSGATADDREGHAVETSVESGTIIVPEVPKAGALKIGSAEGAPGDIVTIDAVLSTTIGAQVVVVQNDVDLTPYIQAGKTSCRVNPSVDQDGVFDTAPRGCTASGTCTGLSADVGDETHQAPYFSGDVVYSCDLQISGDAPPGDYTLGCDEVLLRDYETGLINSHCEGGTIRVVAAGTPTPTGTPRAFTATPTDGPTQLATSTAASTRGDAGGCSVTAPPTAGNLWPLLAAGAVLGFRYRALKRRSE
jgi:hypothetical protein